jgi:hypothetical protein
MGRKKRVEGVGGGVVGSAVGVGVENRLGFGELVREYEQVGRQLAELTERIAKCGDEDQESLRRLKLLLDAVKVRHDHLAKSLQLFHKGSLEAMNLKRVVIRVEPWDGEPIEGELKL